MPFSYKPLDKPSREIRVLDVFPNAFDEPLRASVRTVSLSAEPKPEYETVSYVWGDKNRRAEIVLDGFPFDVPASSKEALQNLRSETSVRTTWIDAVCINQDDVEERNHQVALMGAIYRSCIRTRVWLGHVHENDGNTANGIHAAEGAKAQVPSPAIFKIIDGVLQEMYTETDNMNSYESTVHNADGIFQYAEQSMSLPPEDLQNINDFFSRPWFRRIWVVQEAVLGPDCVCHLGLYVRPMLDILRAATWLTHKGVWLSASWNERFGPGNASTIQMFADRVHGSFATNTTRGWGSMSSSSAMLRSFQATDAKDMVFGALGLTKWSAMDLEYPTLIATDYRKTVRETFRDATRFAICESKTLKLLGTVSHRIEDAHKPLDSIVPSWVVRWDRVRDPSRGDHLSFQYRRNQELRPSSVPEITLALPKELNIIVLTGIRVGHVSHIGPLWQYVPSAENIGAFFRDCMTVFDSGMEEEKRMHWLTSILLAGITRERQCACASCIPGLGYDLGGLMKRCSSISSLSDLPQDMIELLNDIDRTCVNRRLLLAGTFLGIGPLLTEKGDVVYELTGSQVPLALRPCKSSNGCYYLLGECHVDGPDYEQLLIDWKDGKLNEDIIKLM